MSEMFTPWSLKGLELNNRLMRSATWEGMADDRGIPRRELGELWTRLAHGGIGLIVAGYAHVVPRGKGLPLNLDQCTGSPVRAAALLEQE